MPSTPRHSHPARERRGRGDHHGCQANPQDTPPRLPEALSRTVLPTLAALQLMQRANRKALQQTCRAPGGVNGRRPRGRPAVMLMRAPKARGTDRPREGTRRRQPRRRRTAKLRPTHLLERKRRGAASSSIRVGTWKLNCRLPGRGGNGDEIKCRQACSEMASVAYCGRLGAGQLVAVCLLVSTHSFKGPTDSCKSTTFQEPPAPGVRWWLPLVLQQQQLGDASILLRYINEYHPAVALCESETESVAPTTSPPNGLYGYGNVSMFMMFKVFF